MLSSCCGPCAGGKVHGACYLIANGPSILSPPGWDAPPLTDGSRMNDQPQAGPDGPLPHDPRDSVAVEGRAAEIEGRPTDAKSVDAGRAIPELSLAGAPFVGFLTTQFFGAFNDNLFKQLLLLLAVPTAAAAAEPV